MSQAYQYGVHLKLKKSKCFKCSSFSVTKCLLSLGPWSCPGDCAACSSWTFINATPAREIIYSSMGCSVLHTLLIFIWVEAVRGVGVVS